MTRKLRIEIQSLSWRIIPFAGQHFQNSCECDSKKQDGALPFSQARLDRAPAVQCGENYLVLISPTPDDALCDDALALRDDDDVLTSGKTSPRMGSKTTDTSDQPAGERVPATLPRHSPGHAPLKKAWAGAMARHAQ
eukprot:286404-Pelagomonas_calceolata.AAC.2